MATTRSTGYVVTAATWNNVLTNLSDAGILAAAGGGTGLTTFTAANRIPYAASATALTTASTLTYDPAAAFTASFTGTSGVGILALPTASPGAAVHGFFELRGDSGRTNEGLYSHSSSYTPSGAALASSLLLYASGAGGLSIQAGDASGSIRLYPNGATSPSVTLDGTGLKIASGEQLWMGETVNTSDAGSNSTNWTSPAAGNTIAGWMKLWDVSGNGYWIPVFPD